MQVTETLSSGLKREFKVVVNAAELDRQLTDKLQELAAKANIRGFRPGKVPVPHLKRIYGKSVMGEVVQKTIDDESRKVVEERNLKPAYQPEVKLPEDKDEVERIFDGKGDLAFSVAFEVIPSFELQDLGGLTLERHVVAVEQAHVDEALGRIALQYKDFEARPEGAGAATGDRVTISFIGKVDGAPFEGGTAEDVPLELGSGQFLPGFEDQLSGVKAGEQKTLNITFPEIYGVATLAGKPGEFDVTVKSVEAPKPAVLDDDFAKKLGFEDFEKLTAMVRGRLSQEFGSMTAMKLKRDVLDALDKAYSFELPEKLVQAEFDGIWTALNREMQRENKSFEDEDTTEEKARAEYRAIAERRVRLGLVLGTLGEKEAVAVTEEELQRALIERLRQFPGQEKRLIEHFRKNNRAMLELRGPIFEQKVVDLIVSRASVSDKTVTRDELAALVRDEDEHDHDHHHHDEDHEDHHEHRNEEGDEHHHGPHHHHDHAHEPAAKPAAKEE